MPNAKSCAERERIAAIEARREAQLMGEAESHLQRRRIESRAVEIAQLRLVRDLEAEIAQLRQPEAASEGVEYDEPQPILRPVEVRKRGGER